MQHDILINTLLQSEKTQSNTIELNQANFYNSITEFLANNYLDYKTVFKLNSLGKFGKVQNNNSTKFSKENQPLRFISIGNDNYVNNITGEITNSKDSRFIAPNSIRKQSEKTRKEKMFSLIYLFRNSLWQLRFITLTCKEGTNPNQFIKAIETLLEYFVRKKLITHYVYKVEPQQNGTPHTHLICSVAGAGVVSDFIKKNRKLSNYNGKPIENLYQLIRYKFESLMNCLGTTKLHCEFLEITPKYKLRSESGKIVKATDKQNNEYAVKLQNYVNKGLKNGLAVTEKLNEYMLKCSNVNNVYLGVKHDLRYSKNIPAIQSVYISASDLTALQLKFSYFCKQDYLIFGQLEINDKFFNYFEMLLKQQQSDQHQADTIQTPSANQADTKRTPSDNEVNLFECPT